MEKTIAINLNQNLPDLRFVNEIIKETEKAFYFSLDKNFVGSDYYKGSFKVWIPKSAMEIEDENNSFICYRLKKWFYKNMDRNTKINLGLLI